MEAISATANVYVDTHSALAKLEHGAASPDVGSTAAITLADAGITDWQAYVASGGGDFALMQPRFSAELALNVVNLPADLWSAQHLGRSRAHFEAQSNKLQSILQRHHRYVSLSIMRC